MGPENHPQLHLPRQPCGEPLREAPLDVSNALVSKRLAGDMSKSGSWIGREN